MNRSFLSVARLGLLACSSLYAVSPGAVTKFSAKAQAQEFAVKTETK